MNNHNTYYNYLINNEWLYVRYSVDKGHVFKKDDILLSIMLLVDKNIPSDIVTHIEFKYSNKKIFKVLYNTSLDELKNYFRIQKIKKIINNNER